MSRADGCGEEQRVAMTSDHVIKYLSPKTMLMVQDYLPMFEKGTTKGPLVPRKASTLFTHDTTRRSPEEMYRKPRASV